MTVRHVLASIVATACVVALPVGASASAIGVDGTAVMTTLRTGRYASDGSLVVRRGAFVRLGVEVDAPGTCREPAFLLRDVATDRALLVPLLGAADGLAVALANRAALGRKSPKNADAIRRAFDRTLAGALDGTLAEEPGLAAYVDAVAAAGTPYAAMVLARGTGTRTTRVATALWLPEHMPIGAFALSFACAGTAVTAPMPLVVLFNPHDATAPEFLADETLRKTTLEAPQQKVIAGPIEIPFAIDGTAPITRDAALTMLSTIPLEARRSAKGILMYTVEWSDASGHFDVWDGTTMKWSGGSWSGSGSTVLAGRWDGDSAAVVVQGATAGGTLELVARTATQPLIGRYTFDDGHGLDSSRNQHQLQIGPVVHVAIGATVASRMTEGSGGPLAACSDGSGGGACDLLAKTVGGTAHFVDDWQGETAFLRIGMGGYPAATTATETVTKAATEPWTWSSSTDVVNAWRTAGKPRARYGQCWVFAGTTTALLRSIGLPTRVVTNLDSAHERMPAGVGPANRAFVRVTPDGKGEATWNAARWIGEDPKDADRASFHVWTESAWKATAQNPGGSEAIWNFHVWASAWTGDGWNAFDGTPQEASTEWMATGSAGLAAVVAARTLDAPAVLVGQKPVVWLSPVATKP